MLITSCKGLKVINLRVHVCMWKYYERFEIRRRRLAPGPHMVSSMGGASTSAIFTPEVGINYPRLSPIIRRQRYLNSHLLPMLTYRSRLGDTFEKILVRVNPRHGSAPAIRVHVRHFLVVQKYHKVWHLSKCIFECFPDNMAEASTCILYLYEQYYLTVAKL